MWKLLLVDDEPGVVESICSLMDWERCAVGEVSACLNGPQALEQIRRDPPDIIITDIKMPVMNGIELIEQAAGIHGDMEFIILSGHDDFAFATGAMRHGVRHYLLKPCGEEEITQAVLAAGDDLRHRRRIRSDALARERMELELARQCIRLSLRGDWVAGTPLPQEGAQFWFQRFDCPLELPCPDAVYHALSALSLPETELVSPAFWMSGALGAFYICRGASPALAQVVTLQKRLGELLGQFLPLREAGPVALGEIPDAVDRSCGVRGTVLLLEPGCARQEQRSLPGEVAGMDSAAARVERAMDAGTRQELEQQLQGLFAEDGREFATLVCTRLLLRRLHEGVLDASRLTALFNRLYEGDGTDPLVQTLCDALERPDLQGGEETFVDTVRRYLEDHLADPGLSLRRIAKEVVFRSEDYVGKTFSRQMGVSFTQYLNHLRIERAKYLIGTLGEDKLYTVAEQIGLGNNPQYFSKLFKRHTGYTPREYKRLGKGQSGG